MVDTVQVEDFHPVSAPAPDWSAAVNWSGGVVPGAGVVADVTGATVAIDPGVTIAADVSLSASNLIGNGGAVVLGAWATLSVAGKAAVYAYDSVVNQGVMTLGAGSALDVVVDLGAVSGLTGAAPPSFANSGAIGVGSGATLDVGGTEFENSGTIALTGGMLDVTGGAFGGGGIVSLANGALAAFGDGVADQGFAFGTGGGTVSFADPLLDTGVALTGFGAGDFLLLPGLADARIMESAGLVTILNGAGLMEGSFALGSTIQLAATAAGAGSAIVVAGEAVAAVTVDPPCFARGTAILTPSGYRPVESLGIGDAVVAASGAVRPIIWAGSRTVDIAAYSRVNNVYPICIMPGALGHGLPRRALRLSPDHALLFDGVLIPAKLLVNGATIAHERTCLAVTYHHIELARHDVVLAEGVACETYLDTGNRVGFGQIFAPPVRPKRWDRDACAPLCTAGPLLRAVRTRLHTVAATQGFAPGAWDDVSLWIDGAPAMRGDGAAGDVRFILPVRHAGRAVIRSARFVPAEFDPDSEDRRELGIAVAGWRAGRARIATEALAESGFHPRAAGDAALWTDGAGVIRIEPGLRRLVIDIAALPMRWSRAGASA